MTSASTHDAGRLWRRAPGVTLLGAVSGSGLVQPTCLVERPDGQVVQLSELLNLVLDAAGTGRSPTLIALEVSRAYGRELTVDGLQYVIESKLAPLGLIEDAAVAAPTTKLLKADPLLALRLRGTIIPTRVVRLLARWLGPLYLTPVVILAVAGFVALDITLLVTADAASALEQTLVTPVLILALYAMLVAGGLIHELGHATACRFGGAQPGVIGFGLYLVFPAFFTNVTDSYRLGRAGRLRTDLGGLYFNVWCVLIAGAGFLLTGQGILLLLVIAMQLQMLQQLPPTIRLDGYFVLADLAGVPDLFARVGPVMRSLLPGRPVDPRVAELRPAARRIVTTWVIIVIPLLIFSFGWLLWALPIILAQTGMAITENARSAAVAFQNGQPAGFLLSSLSILLLVLPLAGLVVVAERLTVDGARFFHIRYRRLRQPRSTVSLRKAASTVTTTRPTTPRSPNSAEAPAPLPPPDRPRDRIPTLRDFLADRSPDLGVPAQRGWQSTVRHVTGGAVSPPPGRQETRRRHAIATIQQSFDGPRTIAVVNPKGGAHKTTATLLIASTFGIHRGGYTLAWDNNETRGTLGWRAQFSGHDNTAVDLLRDLDRFDDTLLGRVGDLDRYVRSQGSAQFDILASDEDAAGAATIGADEFERLHRALCRFYRIIVVDTGNNMRAPNWEAAVGAADQLVIVSTVREDTAASAMWMADGLCDKGHEDKVRNAVTVLAAPAGPPDRRLHDRARAHFEQLTRAVVDVPHDPALVSGGHLDVGTLQPTTRDAWLYATAAVADGLSAASQQ
jgi:putative peptide zinc metalloprotease protein